MSWENIVKGRGRSYSKRRKITAHNKPIKNLISKLKREFESLWNSKEHKLINLKAGRLEVSENKIFYCAGQFAPTEIHLAVLEYFRNIAPDKKNKLLFVSYQVNGTLGRRVMDGARQVSIFAQNGKVEVVTINCATEKLEGFRQTSILTRRQFEEGTISAESYIQTMTLLSKMIRQLGIDAGATIVPLVELVNTMKGDPQYLEYLRYLNDEMTKLSITSASALA